jgi:lysophospholipase L1-like esterase
MLVVPEILALTGWTTRELLDGMDRVDLLPLYDYVTLLIGVNNQYRGLSLDGYSLEFSELLQRAIAFSGGLASRVVVLSIPDWGATPFADGRDRKNIAEEIDRFNRENERLTVLSGATYIDITPYTRANALKEGYLTEDALHPSGREYGLWAEKIATAWLAGFR